MKTQQTLKLLTLVSIAFAIASCSTESKFAMHIRNSDMVRVEKNPAPKVKHESLQREYASVQKINTIESTEIRNQESTSPILSKEEVVQISNARTEKYSQTSGIEFAKNTNTKPNFVQKLKVIKKINQLSKEQKVAGNDRLILEVILAIFIPPLGVYLHSGISTPFWISLILTLLFFTFPIAVIYSLLVVLDII